MEKPGVIIFYTVSKFLHRLSKTNGSDFRNSEVDYRKWREKNQLLHFGHFGHIELSNRDVLDFGCGTGELCLILAEKARSVLGVELCEESLELAINRNGRSNVHFRKSFADRINCDDNSIDIIFSLDVLEHIENVNAIVEEWGRVLRPGGFVCIAWQSWWSPYAAHIRSYSLIPWAHFLFRKSTILKALERIYDSSFYVAKYWDLDRETGQKKLNPWSNTDAFDPFLNEMSIRKFRRIVLDSGLLRIHMWDKVGIQNSFLKWTKVFARIPFVEEFFVNYNYIILKKEKRE